VTRTQGEVMSLCPVTRAQGEALTLCFVKPKYDCGFVSYGVTCYHLQSTQSKALL